MKWWTQRLSGKLCCDSRRRGPRMTPTTGVPDTGHDRKCFSMEPYFVSYKLLNCSNIPSKVYMFYIIHLPQVNTAVAP